MTLKEYSQQLSKLAKKHPDAKVVYAIDDEGNAFSEVTFSPTPGSFDGHDFDDSSNKINSVCIN